MKVLLLITLIGIKAASSSYSQYSSASNKDVEDELENLDYNTQSKQNGAIDKESAEWELWDRQNDNSEIKDTENSENFEEETGNEFEKQVQSAVKRESGPSGGKCSVLQIDPQPADTEKIKKDETARENTNGKKLGTRSSRPCKAHSTRSCAPHTHRSTYPAHRTASTHRRTNCSSTTPEPTETILVQEPFKLDSDEVYSVCDMDGNWSWPLSTKDSKKWLKWLWVLPCLLLGVLLFLLFVRTCQNYAEQRASASRSPKCRNKMCQQYQDMLSNASSPLIKKLEPRRYQSPGPPGGSVVGQRSMKSPFPTQMSQMGAHMGQMGMQMSQMGPQMQRRHSMNHVCSPMGPRIPSAVPSVAPSVAPSAMGKTHKMVFIRSPQQFAVPRGPGCCPRQGYYGSPPQQTHLQQQCLPLGQHQMQPQIQQQRRRSGSPPYNNAFRPPPQQQPPLRKKGRSSPDRASPFSRECSRSPSPRLNQT